MPFDPRLIHPDQPPLLPGGELDLPADLMALAEQLTDDAAHLAARYPADCASQGALAAELVESAERIKRYSRPRRSLLMTAAVIGAGLASIAALGITVALAWRPDDNQASDGPVITAAAAGASAGRAELNAPPPTPPLHSSATLSVGELSGPELEALLDLLNGEPHSVASISF
jgi:hypothetical protein